MNDELRSITAIPCCCMDPACDWRGVTGDCEATEDGDLFCPKCEKWLVDIEYNEHELNPSQSIKEVGQ